MSEQFARVPTWIFDSAEFTAHEKLVFAALCRFQNSAGGCFPSVQRLAEVCKVSATTANIAIRGLVEKGAIERNARRHNGHQTSNFYTVRRQRETLPDENRQRDTLSADNATHPQQTTPYVDGRQRHALTNYNTTNKTTINKGGTPLGTIESWAKRMSDELKREREELNKHD